MISNGPFKHSRLGQASTSSTATLHYEAVRKDMTGLSLEESSPKTPAHKIRRNNTPSQNVPSVPSVEVVGTEPAPKTASRPKTNSGSKKKKKKNSSAKKTKKASLKKKGGSKRVQKKSAVCARNATVPQPTGQVAVYVPNAQQPSQTIAAAAQEPSRATAAGQQSSLATAAAPQQPSQATEAVPQQGSQAAAGPHQPSQATVAAPQQSNQTPAAAPGEHSTSPVGTKATAAKAAAKKPEHPQANIVLPPCKLEKKASPATGLKPPPTPPTVRENRAAAEAVASALDRATTAEQLGDFPPAPPTPPPPEDEDDMEDESDGGKTNKNGDGKKTRKREYTPAQKKARARYMKFTDQFAVSRQHLNMHTKLVWVQTNFGHMAKSYIIYMTLI